MTAVSWLSNGTVMIAAGQSIRLYEKWMNLNPGGNTFGLQLCVNSASLIQKKIHFKNFKDHPPSTPVPSNIFAAASKLSGRLPDYHPQLLLNFLIWGKFLKLIFILPFSNIFLHLGEYSYVKHLLSILYYFVKISVEGGGKFTYLPVPLLRLLNTDKVC